MEFAFDLEEDMIAEEVGWKTNAQRQVSHISRINRRMNQKSKTSLRRRLDPDSKSFFLRTVQLISLLT